jgi:hypothetical protein
MREEKRKMESRRQKKRLLNVTKGSVGASLPGSLEVAD